MSFIIAQLTEMSKGFTLKLLFCFFATILSLVFWPYQVYAQSNEESVLTGGVEVPTEADISQPSTEESAEESVPPKLGEVPALDNIPLPKSNVTNLFQQLSGYGSPYFPEPKIITPSPTKFPTGSDIKTWLENRKSMQKFQSNLDIGREIAKKYNKGEKWDKDEFKEHEWKQGIGGFRDPVDAIADWYFDTFKALQFGETDENGNFKLSMDLETFIECLEPRLVRPWCSSCYPACVWATPCNCHRNLGYTFEYWWPEETIGTNNFGVSAFNPLVDGQVQFLFLAKILDVIFPQILDLSLKAKGGEGADKDLELQGQSHTAGIQPGDQTLDLESHMYQTQVGWSSSDQSCRGCGFCGFEYPKPYCFPIPFWYNGYKKGNPKCFYDTLDPPDRITSGWTEELEFAPYKRLPEASILADAEMYISSSPISTAIAEGPKGLVKDTSYAKHRSCASYRLAKWPGRYFDLLTSLGVTPLNLGALDKICYFGGGELYPLVGSLLGNFHPLTGSNYIARRSLEIFSNPNSNRRDYPRRPPRYADQDNVDKLQRLYPDGKASKCFRMNDVDERDKDLFPKDLEREKHMGENRYIYWNKRTACTCEYRGGTHAWEDSPKIDLCSVRKPPTGMIGWGCIAGRDPGGLDIPFPIRPRQSYSDHQLGRGDLFEQNVEGIELPFFMPPFEAAGRLYPWGDFTR